MCRYAAYLGPPLVLSQLIYKPPNSLVHQAKEATQSSTRINADGFGVAWYSPEIAPEPAVFKDTSPMWNNRNLGSIAGKIRSSSIVAHVRSALSFDPVMRENCHPFQRGRLLWMHNGDIPGRARLSRQVAMAADDTLLAQIRGNTDTEWAFTLFLTNLAGWPEERPTLEQLSEAMRQTLSQIAGWHRESEDERPLEMNFCVSDGRIMVAARFAIGAEPGPTLHWYRSAQGEGPATACIASEPLFEGPQWHAADNGDLLLVDKNRDVERQRL
jgi:predicted glutamine amidotransferase